MFVLVTELYDHAIHTKYIYLLIIIFDSLSNVMMDWNQKLFLKYCDLKKCDLHPYNYL